MRHRVQMWGSWALAVACALALTAHVFGQDLERRTKALEDLHPEAKFAEFSTRLESLEWIERTTLGAVIAQLALQGFAARRRRRDEE